MPDLRRIPVAACVLLVALRMFIGWQMFYEGIWKIDTLDTPEPWSSEGYLKNAVGPMRGVFREIAGDPDDLDWLDYDTMAARWDSFHRRFLAHYPDLTDQQKAAVDRLLNGQAEYVVSLTSPLPPGVAEKFASDDFEGLRKILRYDPEKNQFILDGKMHLLPREQEKLLAMVNVEVAPGAPTPEESNEVKEFRKAINKLYNSSNDGMGYKERLAASLKGDPTRVGKLFVDDKGEKIEELMGDIRLYREQLNRYNDNKTKLKVAFQEDHLKRQWAELQELRSRVVGPIKGLENELKKDARLLLTTSQLAYGPVPEAASQIRNIDRMTIWSLTILGFLLIVGLASRIAAVASAGLLFLFYMAMPPWPGVPEILGTEHAYIVNKNLIEVCALLGLACMPTGAWFGLDSLFYGWWVRRRVNAESGEVTTTSSRERVAASV